MLVDVPGSTTDLGEGEENSPHLTLVAETILSDGLQLGVTRDNCQSIDFDMKRSTLAFSGQELHTDERTRMDVLGPCRSWSRNVCRIRVSNYSAHQGAYDPTALQLQNLNLYVRSHFVVGLSKSK
mgnify:CR=1 FL=1